MHVRISDVIVEQQSSKRRPQYDDSDSAHSIARRTANVRPAQPTLANLEKPARPHTSDTPHLWQQHARDKRALGLLSCPIEAARYVLDQSCALLPLAPLGVLRRRSQGTVLTVGRAAPGSDRRRTART